MWCVDASVLRHVNEVGNPKTASLRGIAWIYDTRLLEQSFQDMEALDSSSQYGELMLLWEPPSLDVRIANQSGLLSIMNGGTSSQSSFLQKHVSTYPELVLRIIISASMKAEARDLLDQNNISERSLFPGLPGLCAWLKRYYGTSW